MNQIVTKTRLPAHLAFLQNSTAVAAVNDSMASGLSVGGWPRISIKGGRWRLQHPSQEEIVVPQHFLDVIIVDANPHGVSKRWYEQEWSNETPDGVAPACWSDNGVGPSSKSAKPQCGTCAACPKNEWGSKISKASGKAIKACGDVKKLAVLIANNPDGAVFELDVPGASLGNLAAFSQALGKHGIPVAGIVTRLVFDTAVSYPAIKFEIPFIEGRLPYLDEAQAAGVQDVLENGMDEVALCTGKNDVPIK